MSGYTNAEKIVYAEALRTVPGLISAKERKAPEDASALFDAYMRTATKHGMSSTVCWSILFNASIHWAHQLAQRTAAASDRTTLDVTFSMGAVASGWTP